MGSKNTLMPNVAPSHLPSRTACGRADLVRALADGDVTLATLVNLLGYQEVESDAVAGKTVMATDDTRPVIPTIESDLKWRSPLDIPFWRLEAVEYRDESGLAQSVETDDDTTVLPTWPQSPQSPPVFRELTPWRELLPRLRSIMAEQCDTRLLNVPAIVKRLNCGDSLERLPRLKRRRWGQSVTVIEDRSDRLIPYWRDQSRVRSRIKRLFPPYAFEHLLFWEGLSDPVPAHIDGRGNTHRPPPPGSLVVVLGDLGCLAVSGQKIRRYWTEFGRRMVDGGCRTLALTPVPPDPYSLELSRYWQWVFWERVAGCLSSTEREAAVERLLTLLSPASRIEPGLLREVRLWAGGDVATESAFWQHSALVSDSSVAATLDAQVARGRRPAFAGAPKAAQQAVMQAIRRWRGGLRPEVWYAEIQGLERKLRDRLIEPEEIRQSERFIAALGHRLKDSDNPTVPEGTAAWFRFIEPRLPEDYRSDPELGEHFLRLWHLAHAHESQSASTHHYDPAMFPTPKRELRRVMVWQQGEALCFAPDGGRTESRPGGSPVARIETRNGELQVASASADPSFWKSGHPPDWADDWGTDEYGHWVTFSITNKQGQKIAQRMRWIEPGTFLMGSPADEPDRYDNESPQHSVTIKQGYWLFDTACTQALWEAVMGENPSGFKGADRPVENVSWNDCQKFIQRLNERLPGLDLALPFEAQWEYACRAGTTTPFSFGATITPEQVNYNGDYPYAGGKKGLNRQETVPVASLPANPWGLYEMHGNVWEWCQDHWHGNYLDAPTDGSAWLGGTAGADRVLRGGSWLYGARSVRAACRLHAVPGLRDDDDGFRCARFQGEQSQPGAEPAGPARGRQAERRPEQGLPGEATRAEPTLLRLDAGQSPIRCLLPQASAFLIHTDREHLTFRSLTKPAWASAIGRDRFGLWCEITVEPIQGEPVIQRLRWIPPGRFWMGSPEEETRGLAKNDDEREWFDAEHPRHLVTLTEGYWLFDTPCTQALWQAVMGSNPSRFQSPTRPVEQVGWSDTQDFLKRFNGRIPGLNLVLPSEAQWEYACRAGTETAIYTGALEILGTNNAPMLDPIAWYGGNSGVDFDLADGVDSSSWQEKQHPHTKAGTRPVKLKQANLWGLYDMLGNVWEWCQDGMRDYDQDAQTNPTGFLDAGAYRVLRGGSWNGAARGVRAAYRGASTPASATTRGFRCARVQGEQSQPAGKSDAPGAGVAPSGAPGRQDDGQRSGFGQVVRDLWKRLKGS